MAHELSFAADGAAEMAYRGETPWHGLGQKVSEGASIEQWLEEARMTWEIRSSPVQYTNGSLHDYGDFRVLYRSDSNAPLSVVSDRYKVVQPRTMVEFFRSLVEREGFEIETVGSLKGGRRIWALARTDIENDVVASDRIKAYLLLITSCDGSLATTAKFISTRVVCWNTQAIALGESGHEVRVRHNSLFDANEVKGDLGLLGGESFEAFMWRMRTLSSMKVSQSDAHAVLSKLLPTPTNPQMSVEESKGFRTIMELFNGHGRGSRLMGVEGTAWGLLNAVTEYTDHHMRARSAENRLSSAWFGVGANLKAAAEEALLLL
jgi:phage/plasmid-like protein (TIGR03299 family)